MSHIGESRRPRAGPGILPLQHHSYEEEGLELDDRRCVVAMRIVGKEHKTDAPIYGSGTVGDVHGAFLWPAGGDQRSRPVGAWTWVFPSVVPSLGGETTPDTSGGPGTPTPTARGETTPGSRPVEDDDARWVLRGRAWYKDGKFYGKADPPPGSGWDTDEWAKKNWGGGEGGKKNQAQNIKPAPKQDDGDSGGGGGGEGNAGNAGGGVNDPGGGWAGKKVWLPLMGGKWVNPFPNAGAVGNVPNVFGLGVDPLYPVFAIPPPAPSPTPRWFTEGGGLPKKGQARKQQEQAPPQENKNAAWMMEAQEQPITTERLPVRGDWRADRRFGAIRAGKPVGWPEIPRGMYGATVTATDEDRQVEMFLLGDPRLIAANDAGPWSAGTPVCDLGPTAHVSLKRSARLHSAFRVVVAPKVSQGPMKGNSERGTPANVLALNLGPSGQGDTYGGLVADLPTGKEGKITHPSGRILGALSCLYGGPFDVTHYGDKHEIGKDADGNPIVPLHLSTDTYWKVRGDIYQDGPMRLETYRDGGDLDFPVAVHWGFDYRNEDFAWWTTSYIYKPHDPPFTPDPQPNPEYPPREPRDAEPPDGPGSPPDRVHPGDSRARVDRIGAAILKDLSLACLSGRPNSAVEGEPDFRYGGRPDMGTVRQHDRLTPITSHLAAYGGRYGETGGYIYTHGPEVGRYPPTGNGGYVFLPPEVRLEDGGDTYAPKGLSLSTSYWIFGPGTYAGVGTPDLSSGGLKNGVRFGLSGTDLQYTRMGSDGSAGVTMALLDMCEVVTRAVPVVPGDLNDITDTTLQKQVGFRTDAGSEGLYINIGGTLFSVALT